MQGETILGILLSGHAEVLPLHKIARLSQVARACYQLTWHRLLPWRALQVIVAKRPGALGVQLTGAISTGSWYTHALVSSLLMLYKHFLVSQQGPPHVEIRFENSDGGDLMSSSESGQAD